MKQVIVLIHVFSGTVETYATIGGLSKAKGWSDSSLRKKCKTGSCIYNEWRIEITYVR